MKVEELIGEFWNALDATRIVGTIFPLTGGWESWAQVELASMLATRLNRDKYRIHREERSIYKNVGAIKGLRADLVVEHRKQVGTKIGYRHHLFELKCERSDKAFTKAELTKDVEKWELVRSPEQPGMKGTASVAQIFIGASAKGLGVLSGAVEHVLDKKASKVFTVERELDGLWLRARTWAFSQVESADAPLSPWP